MVIPELEMLLRMGAGMVLGAVIGYERERTGHPAGLRTHLLVCLASATFMVVSTQFTYFQLYGKDDLISVDTSRIAASVVSGVGFLGAGAILRTGISIQGLTTAASLWLSAAVGLAAGGGMYLVALASTAASLFCLVILRQVEGVRWHLFQRQIDIIGQNSPSRYTLIDEMRRLGATVTDLEYEYDIADNESHLVFKVRLANEQGLEQLLLRLESLPGIRRLKVQRVG